MYNSSTSVDRKYVGFPDRFRIKKFIRTRTYEYEGEGVTVVGEVIIRTPWPGALTRELSKDAS